MQEILEQVLSEARSAWRFRWLAAAAAWAIGLVGLVGVSSLPDIYGASARIYVDGSSVLRPLLGNQVVAPDVTTTLLYARQALLGREYLLRVISENGLYEDAVTETDREKVVEKLRDEIVIDAVPVDPSSRANGSSIFTLWYRHKRPEVAEGVVRSFMNFLIEDTLAANREGTDTTARFLDDRIAELEARLDQAEQARAEFQRANADTLPATEGGYFERMQRENDELEKTRRELRLVKSRRDRLQQQLTSEAPLVTGDATLIGQPRPDSIDERIRVQRAEIDALLLQYTTRHPQVIARQEQLDQLIAQRAAQLRELGIANPDQQISTLGKNPVYQAVQIRINETDAEIAQLEADVGDREHRLSELRSLIEKAPGVEAELTRLNRDYEVIKDQYELLVQSREKQNLSQQASTTDQVDFDILNPPRAETRPVAPRRLMLLAAVLAAALGGGAGLAWVLAQLRPVFSTSRALREFTGFPVIGSVSRVFVDPLMLKKRRFALVSFSVAIASLVLLVGSVALVELVGPGVRSLFGGA